MSRAATNRSGRILAVQLEKIPRARGAVPTSTFPESVSPECAVLMPDGDLVSDKPT